MVLHKIKQFALVLIITFLVGSYFAMPAQGQGVSAVEQQYVIKLENGNTAILAPISRNLDRKFPFSKNPSFQNVYGFSSSLSLQSLRTLLAGTFDYLEVDQPVSTSAVEISALPNDPGFSHNPANIDRQWGLHKARFTEAWGKTKGSANIIVAVIDTGIDATHEDFGPSRFVSGYNVLTGKSIAVSQNSDDNGHGTLIAGVVGAATNNSIGIAGAAWNVSLMPIKALNAKGSGTSSEISEAIVWAADNGADIVNMSLGGIGFAHDTTLANAITYAFNKNVVVIAAAGNDVAVTGGNLDVEPVFPICDDNGKNMIIGVTATDVNDLKPDFANYGKACVDVSAPGKRILSTINHDPATGSANPDSYAYASGTSLAVPFVSAQAALLKSMFPFASNRQIRDRILASSDSVDNLNLSQCNSGSCRGLLGSGRINVEKSLQDQIIRILDGDVVQVAGTNTLYYINGGKRQFITTFVRAQRFTGVTPKTVTADELEGFAEGSYAEPLDGTLIKSSSDATVYYMSKGLRLPITYQVFILRGLRFTDIVTLDGAEVGSWIEGSFLTPPEGSLVRTTGNPTVYWTVGGVLHPINYKFWIERGLSIFPVVYVPDSDMAKYPKGDAYIMN